MMKKMCGFGAVFFVAVFSACGASSYTLNDWVGAYTSSDTFALVDGGMQTVSFEMHIAAAGEKRVSVGNVQDNGVVFNPFSIQLTNDAFSASSACFAGSNGQADGVECHASLTSRKDLVMTGKDCATGITFSVSATKK